MRKTNKGANLSNRVIKMIEVEVEAEVAAVVAVVVVVVEAEVVSVDPTNSLRGKTRVNHRKKCKNLTIKKTNHAG